MTDKKNLLSDWLLASDIDGTLNNKLRLLPKRNYKAIQKYVYEYGGNFILASGRSIESMRRHFEKLHLNSGYCVFINGAGVYDYKQEKILWISPINERIQKIVKEQAKKFYHTLDMQVVTPDVVYMVRPSIPSYILALSSRLKRKRIRNLDDLPKENWCKVIYIGFPWTIKKIAKSFAEANGGETKNLMSSSIFSFEVVNEDTNKGVAVLKAAEIIGVDKSKTAAIGDYFNDYEMLKTVAVPACCGQAPEKMKEVAKLVTCHCNRGAVADLIEYIIANRDNL